jgi:hypothetical protein
LAKTNINVERETLQRLQTVLGIRAHGKFERTTHKAILDYQRQHDLPRTGLPDDATVEHILAGER